MAEGLTDHIWTIIEPISKCHNTKRGSLAGWIYLLTALSNRLSLHPDGHGGAVSIQ